MGKVAIVTDSNSGITQDLARNLGVSVIPMPFYINEKLYLEGITLSQEEFYERLKNEESISTSQPGPADVLSLIHIYGAIGLFCRGTPGVDSK